ncbi:hypothetical protein C1646_763233 [Rhizophagus diaphanus]|nr:hypothetical protein C1646_763233 [Rhizophagus diaphanus] [Rhizophagus sp. MUCL 43196]
MNNNNMLEQFQFLMRDVMARLENRDFLSVDSVDSGRHYSEYGVLFIYNHCHRYRRDLYENFDICYCYCCSNVFQC